MIKDVLEKYKERIPVRVLAELLADIDEAEAKFGGHAICYFDCPCEYQTEDINVGKIDEYYKKIRAKAINEFFDELQKYEEDDWLKLKMLSIYHIAEQLKERE